MASAENLATTFNELLTFTTAAGKFICDLATVIHEKLNKTLTLPTNQNQCSSYFNLKKKYLKDFDKYEELARFAIKNK